LIEPLESRTNESGNLYVSSFLCQQPGVKDVERQPGTEDTVECYIIRAVRDLFLYIHPANYLAE